MGLQGPEMWGFLNPQVGESQLFGDGFTILSIQPSSIWAHAQARGTRLNKWIHSAAEFRQAASYPGWKTRSHMKFQFLGNVGFCLSDVVY